jgi:hypothetical protein
MIFQTRCPQCKKTVAAYIVYAQKLSLFLKNESDVLAMHAPDDSDRSDHRWLLTVPEIGNLRRARAKGQAAPIRGLWHRAK